MRQRVCGVVMGASVRAATVLTPLCCTAMWRCVVLRCAVQDDEDREKERERERERAAAAAVKAQLIAQGNSKCVSRHDLLAHTPGLAPTGSSTGPASRMGELLLLLRRSFAASDRALQQRQSRMCARCHCPDTDQCQLAGCLPVCWLSVAWPAVSSRWRSPMTGPSLVLPSAGPQPSRQQARARCCLSRRPSAHLRAPAWCRPRPSCQGSRCRRRGSRRVMRGP